MADNKKPEDQQAMGDDGYFEGMAGEGLEGFTPDTLSTAYLSMVQPGSTASTNHEAGTWRNTATDIGYTNRVEVVALAFKTVWVERDKEPPFFTVGRYMPKSIEVDVTYPKPGTRGFPKMTNPLSGNQVQELFVYALALREHPEDGLLYFSPTAGSMTTCKTWNSIIRSQRLKGSIKPAPIHAFSYYLDVGLVQNPAKPNNPKEQIAKFIRVTRGEQLVKDWHMQNVVPLLPMAQNVVLLAAPEHSGDAE